jgi:hypothetical protein
MIRHIAGITCLQRADRERGEGAQEVIIRERGNAIHLDLTESMHGASLSPEQARQLAAMLIEAADRLEADEEPPE